MRGVAPRRRCRGGFCSSRTSSALRSKRCNRRAAGPTTLWTDAGISRKEHQLMIYLHTTPQLPTSYLHVNSVGHYPNTALFNPP